MAAPACTSRDDIGADLILDIADAILQQQLALLETGKLKLVIRRHGLQRGNGHVEVPMLLPQALEESPQLLFLIRRCLCQNA